MTIDSPDLGHLEPMVTDAEAELATAGIDTVPEVVLTNAGYWHHVQKQAIVDRGMQVPIPTPANARALARAGTAVSMRSCVACSPVSATVSSTPSAEA